MAFNPSGGGGGTSKLKISSSRASEPDPSVVQGLLGGLIKAVSAPATIVGKGLDPAVRELAQGADQLLAKAGLGNSKKNVAARKAAGTSGFSAMEILRGIADAGTSAPVSLLSLGQSDFSPSERIAKALGVKPVNDVSLFQDPALQDNPKYTTGALEFGLNTAQDPLSYLGVGRAGGLAKEFTGTGLKLGSRELADEAGARAAKLLLEAGEDEAKVQLGTRLMKAAGEIGDYGKGGGLFGVGKALSDDTLKVLGEVGLGERRALTLGLPGAKNAMEIKGTEGIADILDAVASFNRSGINRILGKGTYYAPKGVAKVVPVGKRFARETFKLAADIEDPTDAMKIVGRVEALGLRRNLVGQVDKQVNTVMGAVDNWAETKGFNISSLQREMRSAPDRGVSRVLEGITAVKSDLKGETTGAVAGLKDPVAQITAKFMESVGELPAKFEIAGSNGPIDVALGAVVRQPESISGLDLALGKVTDYATDLAAKQKTILGDRGSGSSALNVVEKVVQDLTKEHFGTIEGRDLITKLIQTGIDAPNIGVTDKGVISAARPAIKSAKTFADWQADVEVKAAQEVIDQRGHVIDAAVVKQKAEDLTSRVTTQVMGYRNRVLAPMTKRAEEFGGVLKKVEAEIGLVEKISEDPIKAAKTLAKGGNERTAAIVTSLGLDDTVDNLIEKTAAHEAAIAAERSKTIALRNALSLPEDTPGGLLRTKLGLESTKAQAKTTAAYQARVKAVREAAFDEAKRFTDEASYSLDQLTQAKQQFVEAFGSTREALAQEGERLSEAVDQTLALQRGYRDVYKAQVQAARANQLGAENALSAAQRRVAQIGKQEAATQKVLGSYKGARAFQGAQEIETAVQKTGVLKTTNAVEYKLRNLKWDAFGGVDADEDYIRNFLALDHKGFVDLGLGYYMDENMYKFISRTVKVGDPTKGLLSNFNAVTKLWRSSVLMMPGFSNRNFIGGFIQNLNDGVGIGEYRSAAKVYKAFVKFGETNFKDQTTTNLTLRLLETGKVQWPQEVVEAAAKYGMDPMDLYKTYRQIGEVLGKDVSSRAAIEGNRLLSTMERIQGFMDQNAPGFKTIATLGEGQGVPVEMNLRMAHYMKMRSNGLSDFTALDRTYLLHNDYTDLSEVDIKAKRFFPFWVWRTRNLPLQAQLLSTTNVAGRALQVEAWKSQSKAREEDGGLIPWIAGSTMAFGGGNYLSPQGIVGSADLFDQAEKIRAGLSAGSIPAVLQAIIQPEALGPAVKIPLELATNKITFNGQQITSSDKSTKENAAAQAQYILDNLLPPIAALKRAKDSTSRGAVGRIANFAGWPTTQQFSG